MSKVPSSPGRVRLVPLEWSPRPTRSPTEDNITSGVSARRFRRLRRNPTGPQVGSPSVLNYTGSVRILAKVHSYRFQEVWVQSYGLPAKTEVIPMAVTQIMPQSGLQLLIVVGAAFLMAGIRPDLGMFLLFLGVGMWAVYNLFNIGRQF